jgi:hypothetical protein
MNRVTKSLLVMAAALVIPACTPFPSVPTTYPVRGKIIYADGTPVRAGLVKFHPQGVGVEADVELEKDGTFVLKIYGEQEGTVPGKYRISINPSWPTRQPADARSESMRRVPRRYWSADSTDLVVEVKAQDNQFELKLKGR